jgi:hypothetical protein
VLLHIGAQRCGECGAVHSREGDFDAIAVAAVRSLSRARERAGVRALLARLLSKTFHLTEILPDNMLVCVTSADAFTLGILSSRIHVIWALRAGGWLGVGNDPRYSKPKVFPFPSHLPANF